MAGNQTPGRGHEPTHPVSSESRPTRRALILAGGDGTRLRELTRNLSGDDRPKQFCPLLGEDTLLDGTRRRVALEVPAAQTFFSVTATHERFYTPLLADVRSNQIVVQPQNRGTAPAILFALLRMAQNGPNDTVAILPSDHYVSDDARFMAYVDAGFDVVRARPDVVVLLGLAPDRPETEYGWIEPAEPLAGRPGWTAYGVSRFWEKPAQELAEALLERGCVWNSFVMVGRVGTLLALIDRALPSLGREFLPIQRFLGTPMECTVADAVYQRLPSMDFSRSVLSTSAAQLAVVPVHGVAWSDLGRPERVLALRGQAGASWTEMAGRPVLVGAAG
jgi:mannose-1-phosphate guanylyltransferase